MSVQNKELFQKFVEFCDAQPKDREIDNNSWDFCAVGKFRSSLENPELCIITFAEDLLGRSNENSREQGEEYNLNAKLAIYEIAKTNYGDLTTLLKTYL